MIRTLLILVLSTAIGTFWSLSVAAQSGPGNQGVQGTLTLLDVEGAQGLLFIRGVNFGNDPKLFLAGVVLDILDRHPVEACFRMPDGAVAGACEEIVAAIPDPLPIDPPRDISRPIVLAVATGPLSYWPRPQTESVEISLE